MILRKHNKASKVKEEFYEVVSQYFRYLSMTFPVMCASDEFHFFPRAEHSSNYYHRMESLQADDMEDAIGQLKEFRNQFSRFDDAELGLEEDIDIQLLKANINGMLIELETNRIWCHNPLLYLKIAFIGLDHAIYKPLSGADEFAERFYGRISTIPLLLHNGISNITSVPETYYRSSLAMLFDAKKYVMEIRKNVARMVKNGIYDVYIDVFDNVLNALDIFQTFLESTAKVPDHHVAPSTLHESLQGHFLNTRTLEEIYDIAVNEWHMISSSLDRLAAQADRSASWQELYHAYLPGKDEPLDILSLYRDEMEKLKEFFAKHVFKRDLPDPAVEIRETPRYLQSIRGTASFGAALTPIAEEKSYFYITIDLDEKHSAESDKLLKQRLHREYKFLTAHETIPGHHLLDSIRRRMKSPVRRQVESPLFYEGWASFAESILAESGYLEDPVEQIVLYKRRLWRAARCQIDAGIPVGKLNPDGASDLLTAAGFSADEARRQINRFRLNPGYQLCYTLGAYEIDRLKKKYSAAMGEEKFYHLLLNQGQLPFTWLENWFEASKR